MKSERRRIWKCLLCAVLLTLLTFVSGGCAANTYTVCPDGGCNYTSIQAAINASQPGDTIEVHSGIYYENVNVNKQLILRSVDTGIGKPIVDASGNGSAITLAHDGIVLDGFTAINASSYPEAGILVYSNNNIVINNTALNNYYGILLWSSSNNTLTGNTASNNPHVGIYLFHYSSNNNTLTGNTANSNNDYGIFLDSSSNNNLTGNTASNNYDGIRLESSSNNTLTGNTALNNSHGIFLISLSTNNNLTGNTVSNNGNAGIRLYDSSTHNTLTENTASNNGNVGIRLESSSNNHIYNNYFDNWFNAEDDGNNIWNITKTAGTNIIGGSWLGGNYWSDYTGEDTDGDGLGDTLRPYNSSGGIQNGGDWLPLVQAEPSIFDTDEGRYPSISGTFTGTITPSRNLTVSRLYTYSCKGTGGHTKSITLYENATLRANGVWSGYQGDWHNVTFTEVTLLKGHEYRYVIETGSYPQIVHAESKDAMGGTITCEEFVDLNGKRHEGWIPAIRLS
jgi:parallel beta-helix repeat protein